MRPPRDDQRPVVCRPREWERMAKRLSDLSLATSPLVSDAVTRTTAALVSGPVGFHRQRRAEPSSPVHPRMGANVSPPSRDSSTSNAVGVPLAVQRIDIDVPGWNDSPPFGVTISTPSIDSRNATPPSYLPPSEVVP